MRNLFFALILLAPRTAIGAPPVDNYGDPLPEGATQRYGTIRFRAGGRIDHACMSPDGKYIAGSSDNVVVVWERATGKQVCKFKEDLFSIEVLAFSQDSRELVAVNMAVVV